MSQKGAAASSRPPGRLAGGGRSAGGVLAFGRDGARRVDGDEVAVHAPEVAELLVGAVGAEHDTVVDGRGFGARRRRHDDDDHARGRLRRDLGRDALVMHDLCVLHLRGHGLVEGRIRYRGGECEGGTRHHDRLPCLHFGLLLAWGIIDRRVGRAA